MYYFVYIGILYNRYIDNFLYRYSKYFLILNMLYKSIGALKGRYSGFYFADSCSNFIYLLLIGCFMINSYTQVHEH